MTNETVEMFNELTTLLASISGAEEVQPSFSLSYVVVCKDESSKKNVDAVSLELVKQAEKMNISLEIVSCTKEEIADARARLMNSVA